MADALEVLVADSGSATGASTGGSSGVGVVVTVTLEDLITGFNRTGRIAGSSETIPVGEIRRIACEEGIYPAVLGTKGEVLDMGRRARLATQAHTRALKASYGSCGIDGCDGCFEFCDIYHIVEWLNGGSTDLCNLIPVCSHHHHLVHDDHWTIVRNADGAITLKPS